MEDNAADLYSAAFASLVGEEDRAWSENRCRATDPVPPEAAAWVEQNQKALDLVREASEQPHCWFTLVRDERGDVSLSHIEQVRTLAKLVRWRALLAVQQRDPTTLADLVITLDRVGRHVDSGPPELIHALVGMTIRAMLCDVATAPMLWPELSSEDRAAYLARVTPTFDSPPPLTEALAGEKELVVWTHVARSSAALRMVLAPSSRVAGELERYFRPLLEWAAKPVEQQCDPADPLVVQARALEVEEPPRGNIPRVTASILLPSASRSLVLRARLIAQQRGTRTVLELFAYQDRTGALPDSLETLAGDFTIDPFSGRPFVYRRTDDGFTLYSVGVDRQDDGGRHDPKFGKDNKGRDFVFWPIPECEDRSATSQP
jgi:hypothetical protein